MDVHIFQKQKGDNRSMKRKITIIVEDCENDGQDTNIFRPNNDENDLVIKPGSYYWEKQERKNGDLGEISPVVNPGAYHWEISPRSGVEDNGWVDGIDRCANCPNRPGGPNNKSGICMCAIPSIYGPNRITC